MSGSLLMVRAFAGTGMTVWRVALSNGKIFLFSSSPTRHTAEIAARMQTRKFGCAIVDMRPATECDLSTCFAAGAEVLCG